MKNQPKTSPLFSKISARIPPKTASTRPRLRPVALEADLAQGLASVVGVLMATHDVSAHDALFAFLRASIGSLPEAHKATPKQVQEAWASLFCRAAA